MTVKGGKYLEAVAEADTIVFDKTGTLTKAKPSVVEVVSFDGREPDELLRIAACMEEHFPHSMAKAVVDAAMNCLPPICMSSSCSQMGDPYGMRQDPTTGAWRSTYATFKRCLDVSGIWEYCGHCFSGETVERGTPPPNM